MRSPASIAVPLGEVCSVRSGFASRGSLQVDLEGTCAIQQGDITNTGGYAPREHLRFALNGPSYPHFASAGDVIFRSRGPFWSAWEVPELSDPLVVIAPLFILRPTTDALDPSFLRWLILQPAAQRFFIAQARGTAVQMITKPVLEQLPLELPALPTQRVVAAAAELAVEEHRLTERRADLQHRLRTAQLADVVQEHIHQTAYRRHTTQRKDA